MISNFDSLSSATIVGIGSIGVFNTLDLARYPLQGRYSWTIILERPFTESLSFYFSLLMVPQSLRLPLLHLGEPPGGHHLGKVYFGCLGLTITFLLDPLHDH
jgi:hypothetical protein